MNCCVRAAVRIIPRQEKWPTQGRPFLCRSDIRKRKTEAVQPPDDRTYSAEVTVFRRNLLHHRSARAVSPTRARLCYHDLAFLSSTFLGKIAIYPLKFQANQRNLFMPVLSPFFPSNPDLSYCLKSAQYHTDFHVIARSEATWQSASPKNVAITILFRIGERIATPV